MPLGNKQDGGRKLLEETEKTHGFVFSNDTILPAEQKTILEKVYKRNVRYNGMSEEQKAIEKAKMEEFIEKMVEKLKEYGGSIQGYVGSYGGSSSSSNVVEKKSTADRTFYTVIKINDVLIFEPIGQVNNATFIGRASDENLKEELEKNGRVASVQNNLLGKVTHKRTEEKKYDFESGHLLEIMKFAHESPDDMLSALFNLMKSQESCALGTLDSMIPNGTEKITKGIAEQVENRGISGKDVIAAGTKIVNLQKEEKETPDKEGVEL